MEENKKFVALVEEIAKEKNVTPRASSPGLGLAPGTGHIPHSWNTQSFPPQGKPGGSEHSF